MATRSLGPAQSHRAESQAPAIHNAPAARRNTPPLGNQAVLRRLQAKLQIGASDDRMEREADTVAAQILGATPPVTRSAPHIARLCDTCADEELHRRTAPGVDDSNAIAPPSVDTTLAAPGTVLPSPTRDFFQARLGTDLSGVRVHTDAAAAHSARDVGALAYTSGHHIAFAAGQFAPDTQAGRSLLAHELVHVVQQSGGRRGNGAIRRAPDPAADRATKIKNFQAAVKAGTWPEAALILNGFDPADIDRLLGDLDNDQLRALNTGAPVLMPGWPPVVQDHIAPLLKEADRVAALKASYDAALAATPRDWDNIAVLLNGFSERDVLIRMRALPDVDLRSLDASVQKIMAQWPDRLHRLALRVMLEGAQPDPSSAPGTAPRTTGSTGATAPLSADALAKAKPKTQDFFNTRDATAREFGAADYDDYVRNMLIGGGAVFGRKIPADHPVHPRFMDKLELASVKARAAIGSADFGVGSINGQDNRAGNHAWGLAVDIDPNANPYIINEAGEAEQDKTLEPIYQRIAQGLLHRDSHLTRDQPGTPSGLRSANWTDLAEESDAMVAYFSVLPELAPPAADAGAAPPAKAAPALPPPRKLTAKIFAQADLAKLDVTQVRSDYQKLLVNPVTGTGDAPFTGGGPGKQRDPARGFLSLRQEVVEALRGQGLRWGATDFPGASGDVMHFDDGEHIADYKTWGSSNPTARHAAAASPPPVSAADAGTVQKQNDPQAPPAAVTLVPCTTLPHRLGVRGGCGGATDTDFMALDFPKLGVADTLKVTPFRLLPTSTLLGTMLSDLAVLAGSDGVAATRHFADGTGTKATFAAGSNLADLAAKSASFAAAVQAVRDALGVALRGRAATGTVACDTLSLAAAALPGISFGFLDGVALKAVIGGTHGLAVDLLSLSISPATRSYKAMLQFVICDNFGVDEADLYWPSLLAFWVLQHERPGFAPFVNEIVIAQTVDGPF